MVIAGVVAALMAIAAIAGRRADRAAARWLIGTVVWSVVALAVFAPMSIATLPEELPVKTAVIPPGRTIGEPPSDAGGFRI